MKENACRPRSELSSAQMSQGSSRSLGSSIAKVKLRRAFDFQTTSLSRNSVGSLDNYGKGKTQKVRSRNNSLNSEVSEESLKKIHTFALKQH